MTCQQSKILVIDVPLLHLISWYQNHSKKTCPHFFNKRGQAWNLVKMGTTFLRSDSDKWGQCLKWWQSESRDNLLFHHHKWKMGQIFVVFSEFTCNHLPYLQVDFSERNISLDFFELLYVRHILNLYNFSYRCNMIITTWIQISSQNWNALWKKEILD